MVRQSSKMTSKYILERYKSSQEKIDGEESIQRSSEDVSSGEDVNKDIESSQEKNSGEENIPSDSEDVSSNEDTQSTKDTSQHHSIKLQVLLIWLKLQRIESHIAKVKSNQTIEDVVRYNSDLIFGDIPERVLFGDNDNRRYANTFNAIDTEIISMKKDLKVLRNHRCVSSNEIAKIPTIRSKGAENFLKRRKDPNIRKGRKKYLIFETKKKLKTQV